MSIQSLPLRATRSEPSEAGTRKKKLCHPSPLCAANARSDVGKKKEAKKSCGVDWFVPGE